MSDEFIEFRIPVSLEDRNSFIELSTLIEERRAYFVQEVLKFSGGEQTSSVEANETYWKFRNATEEWRDLAIRLSILDFKIESPTARDNTNYKPRKGLTGHYREQVQRVLRDFDHVVTLFGAYSSISSARTQLERWVLARGEEDDLPF